MTDVINAIANSFATLRIDYYNWLLTAACCCHRSSSNFLHSYWVGSSAEYGITLPDSV